MRSPRRSPPDRRTPRTPRRPRRRRRSGSPRTPRPPPTQGPAKPGSPADPATAGTGTKTATEGTQQPADQEGVAKKDPADPEAELAQARYELERKYLALAALDLRPWAG